MSVTSALLIITFIETVCASTRRIQKLDMILSRLNRALTSNGLLLKGGCGVSSAKQRLTLPSGRPSLTFAKAKAKVSGATEGLLRMTNYVINNALAIIPLVSASGYVLYCGAKIVHFEYRISRTTLTVDEVPHIRENSYIDRSEEKKRLRRLIMAPFPPSSYYHVYQGPHRSGKTQAMLEVVQELRKEGVKGVHFVSAFMPLHRRLADAFSMNQAVIRGFFNAVPYFQRETFEPGQEPGIRLTDVMLRLGKSAKKYENERVTTIIIDGVNKFIEQKKTGIRRTDELRRLLDIAKDHADKGVIHWILVDSSGVALKEMQTFSSSSRMELVFARDVDEEYAKGFLKKRFEATGRKFDADEVYKCATGGRVGMLVKAVSVVAQKPHSTYTWQEQGVHILAAMKRLFGIATHPKRADEDEAEAIKTQEDLLKAALSKSVRDFRRVFSAWPNRDTITEEYQHEILRLLAANPKGVLNTSSLRRRAGQKDFREKGVDCEAAIDQLLKCDLLRYANEHGFALHCNAVKYILDNEYILDDDDDDDDDDDNVCPLPKK